MQVLVSLVQLPKICDFFASILNKEVYRIPCPLYRLHVPSFGCVVFSLNEIHQISRAPILRIHMICLCITEPHHIGSHLPVVHVVVITLDYLLSLFKVHEAIVDIVSIVHREAHDLL